METQPINKNEEKQEEPYKKEWKIILYQTDTGKCPVNDFLSKLSRKDEENMIKSIMYLKSVGNEIRRPHGAFLRDDVYELRVTLKNNNTRTLYFFCFDEYIVLTHTFKKKTQKVPDNEIERAIRYRNNFLLKYNKENIQEVYDDTKLY